MEIIFDTSELSQNRTGSALRVNDVTSLIIAAIFGLEIALSPMFLRAVAMNMGRGMSLVQGN